MTSPALQMVCRTNYAATVDTEAVVEAAAEAAEEIAIAQTIAYINNQDIAPSSVTANSVTVVGNVTADGITSTGNIDGSTIEATTNFRAPKINIVDEDSSTSVLAHTDQLRLTLILHPLHHQLIQTQWSV